MSETVTAFDLARDVLTASGPEAASFLQGQLSQDVLALADGDFAWSWLLAPNGKVDALLRVTRLSTDEWLLDTDAGWGEPVLTRLNRFKLRTKVDIQPSTRTVVGLRGAGWKEAGGGLLGAGLVLSPPWPGVEGADVLLPDGLPAGLDVRPADEYEARRILAGIPRMGAELDERTIPAETGLVAMTASFTKGCYTGQELVARIDSRGGNVPKRLRGLRWASADASGPETPGPEAPGPEAPGPETPGPETPRPGSSAAGSPVVPGTELFTTDGRAAGIVTSVAPASGSDTAAWVGLGYVRRGVEIDETLSTGPLGTPVTQVELGR
ncbi:MAG TPA: hypothetical protein VFH58_17230 [Acidimicrobiales bacterium]|nr:hypothetical protein [Acidimicrobiales bacterium]